MKRVKSACICQTLLFAQKPELGLPAERALELNREDIRHYRATLERSKTKYVIVSETEQADGSIVIRVKKQYNLHTDCAEYLEA